MGDGDVHRDEMDELTPEELEYALDNPDELLVHPVALTLGDLRRSLRSIDKPTPGPALAEFLDISANDSPSDADDVEAVQTAASAVLRGPRKKKEKSMIASATAIAATTAGKILLGSTAAAAAFGGAHLAGVVDVTGGGDDTEIVTGVDADTTTAVAASTPGANLGAAADTRTAADAELQAEGPSFDVGDAGTVDVMVEDGTVRLTGIASNDGWTGALTADSDTELVVAFRQDDVANDAASQVTARVTLIDDPEAGLVVDVEILDEHGLTAGMRFDAQGNVLVEAGAGVEVDAGAGVEIDAEVDTDAGVEVDTGAGAEIDAGGAIEVDTDTGADVDAGAEVEIDAGGAIEVDTDAGVEVDTDTGIVVDTDTGADVDAGAGVEIDAEVDTDAGVEVDTDTGAEIDAGGAIEVDTDTGIDVDTGAGVDANTTVESEADASLDVGGTIDSTTDDLDAGIGGALGGAVNAESEASGPLGLFGSDD